jgi:hypothetical protein
LTARTPLLKRAAVTRGARWAFVAGGVYLAAVLWHVRAVLPAPATLLLIHPSWERDAIALGDQSIVVAAIARGARMLVTAPQRFYDGGQCFPMPNAVTLGEHLIGNGILGIVPYWLSGGEPVFATNVVYALELWIAAMAMYALVLYWTGSFGAALIAGFLFGFLPYRLQDPGHPFLHGNQWTPLVLLFTHRVFVRGRWRDALALTVFACLQVLESFYMIWAMTVLLIVFGIGLALRHRRRLTRVAPLVLGGIAVVGALMWITMKPYLDTAATWGLFHRGGGFLVPGIELLPGGLSYPGTVSLILAGIALLDRLRGRRSPDDPRWLFLAMGFVMVWAVLGALPLPLVGPVPSLTAILGNVVPGLSAGRGMRTARMGIYVVTSFLAAYGIVALTAGRRRVVRAAVFTIVAAAAVYERFAPSFAATQFLFSTGLIAREARPSDALLALHRQFPPGAVLDVPDTFGRVVMLRDHAHYTFLGAYHHQQTGSCYNSNSVPISVDVAALAEQLPRPTAVDALHSLGFRTLVVHGEYFGPNVLKSVLDGLEALVAADQLQRIGDADQHWAYAITRGGNTAVGHRCLAPPVDLRAPLEVSGPSANVSFRFLSNGPDWICRQPDPLAPMNVVVRWRERTWNRTIKTESTRVLVPIAVPPGPALERKVPLALPPEGSYFVSITPEVDPAHPIAQRNVTVVRPNLPPKQQAPP